MLADVEPVDLLLLRDANAYDCLKEQPSNGGDGKHEYTNCDNAY